MKRRLHSDGVELVPGQVGVAQRLGRPVVGRWGVAVGFEGPITRSAKPLELRFGGNEPKAGQVHAYRDRLHARISAEIYNHLDEIERLAAAVSR